MAEDLQYLMERIQKDAVDKAEAEAAAIIARAKDKAAEIVKAAEAEASAKLEKADKDDSGTVCPRPPAFGRQEPRKDDYGFAEPPGGKVPGRIYREADAFDPC